MADIYTLLKNGDSDEYHLFKATWSDKDKKQCTPVTKSICQKMNSSERSKGLDGKNIEPPFACQEEAEARKACAERGRSVCGICVSSLYKTFD